MNLYSKVWNSIRRGRVSAPVNDTGLAQNMQIQKSFGETASHDSWSQYGFSSVPVIGCDVVMLSPKGGDQSNGLIIGSNDGRYRPKGLSGGETQLHDNAGQYVYLKAGTKVVLNAASEIDFMIGGVVVMKLTSAGLQVTGSIMSTGDVVANGISLDMHIHPDVQNGSGSTGLPTG